MKIISLVPSVTQSLVDLGLGDTLAGVTEFCVYPIDLQQKINVIGTPKQIDLELISKIQPDYVFCNREENSQADVEALQRLGIKTVVQFPKTVEQAFQDLWEIARILQSNMAIRQIDLLERSWEWFKASAQENPITKVFCPIWQSKPDDAPQWWMTFNGDTYPGDILRTFGGENVFETRERKYPLEADLGVTSPESAGNRDTRYPRVTLEEIIASQPDLILLPTEPFPYQSDDIAMFQSKFEATPAGRTNRIHIVDGRLLMWHGTYISRTMEELGAFFR